MEIKYTNLFINKILFLLVLITATLTTFTSCEVTPRYLTLSKTYYDILGTNLDIMVIIEENADIDTAKQTMENVASEIRKLEALISSNEEAFPQSEIVAFNKSECGEKTEISPLTAEVFTLAKDLYSATNGIYNPALYYLVEYWGFGNYGKTIIQSKKQPYDENASALLATANFDSIRLVSENGRLFLEKTASPVEYNGQLLQTAIDFGGIGKGFAADLAKDMLLKAGYTGGYISLGSSSIQILENPTEKDGKITVSLINPRGEETGVFNYGKIKLQSSSISSSGDYNKFFIEDGKRYCHIINPRTGFPTNTGIIMSTVVCKSASMGDALSTTLMCMNLDEIRQFASSEFVAENGITLAVIYDNGDGTFSVYENIGIKITARKFNKKEL